MAEVTFRLATAEDAQAIASIYAPIVNDTVISFEYDAPSASDMAARIVRVQRGYPWLVAVRRSSGSELPDSAGGGEVIGYAYADAHASRAAYQWGCNTSIYLAANARGMGLGTALYQRLFALSRLHGCCMAYGGITLPNAASIQLHESLGFVPVGVYREVGYKFEQWDDVGWWQVRLQPASVPAPVWRPFPDVADSPSVGAILQGRDVLPDLH